jgi:hypothetical protein
MGWEGDVNSIFWERIMQCTRTAAIVLAVWAPMDPAEVISARPHKVTGQPVISVRIYNYAHVGKTCLGEAEGEAAGIFARVGVSIIWTVHFQQSGMGPAQREDSDADFFVRILPDSMARKWNYKPGALGESVISPAAEGPLAGGTANVFYDRVEHVSFLWDLDPGEILGDAIAHELGHLLLGARHSDEGIMKARWSAQDLEQAKRGKLAFLPTETTALQRAAAALHNDPSLTAITQH